MPKKIIVQNVYRALLKKMEKFFARFLLSKDLKKSNIRDMNVVSVIIFG